MSPTQASPTLRSRRLPYFSLRQILVLVTFVAVGCAGLINASPWWSQLLFTSTVAALLAAVLVAAFRNGSQRAFALGFATCGGAYLTLILLPLTFKTEGLSEFGSIDGRLLTTHALEYAYHELLPRVRETPVQPVPLSQPGSGLFGVGGGGGNFGGPALTVGGGLGSTTQPVMKMPFYPSLDNFKMVGHSLWAFLLAYVGGMLAQYLERTRKSVSDA